MTPPLSTVIADLARVVETLAIRRGDSLDLARRAVAVCNACEAAPTPDALSAEMRQGFERRIAELEATLEARQLRDVFNEALSRDVERLTRERDEARAARAAIVERLASWEEAARIAWSNLVELPPEECPSPAAVIEAARAEDPHTAAIEAMRQRIRVREESPSTPANFGGATSTSGDTTDVAIDNSEGAPSKDGAPSGASVAP